MIITSVFGYYNLKFYKMIDIHSKHDNMHKNDIFYGLICINNHINSCKNRMLSNPTVDHWPIVKRVLRYLKGTINYSLIYEKGTKDLKVIGYCDSDFAGDVEDRKSTSRKIFYLGGVRIMWNSLKQKVVALSMCKERATTCQWQAARRVL